MEHTLQIVLVAGCAYGLLAAYTGRPVPNLCIVCAILAPAVRYEDFAFTAAVLLVCWLQQRRQAAFAILLLSVLPVALFSLFLHAKGLPWLPCSTLFKGGFASTHVHVLARVVHLVVMNLYTYVYDEGGHSILLMVAGLAGLAFMHRSEPAKRNVLAAAVLGMMLMVLFGPYGWFFRYEVCVRIFGLMVLFGAMVSSFRVPGWIAAAGVCIAASPYLVAALETPFQAGHIYRQQFQMHRFEHDYYRGNVAVNDLGWVSFDRPAGTYVLDLVGLASQESLFKPPSEKDAAWLEGTTARHDVGLVMIYPSWFGQAPSSWVLLGQLHEKLPMLAGASAAPEVYWYATKQANVPLLRGELRQFAASLPRGSWMTLEP